MKKLSKFMSVALVLALVLSLFAGMSVLADDPNGETTVTASPYIAAYEIKDGDGNVASDWIYKPGASVITRTLVITVVDPRVEGKVETGDDKEKTSVNATPHNGTFTAIPVSGEISGTTITFEFKDVGYNGGEASFSFDFSYENLNSAPVAVATLSQMIGQCREVSPDPVPTPEPPEPTATPTPTPAPTAEPDMPKIMVKDFSFGGTSVEAGKEFSLDLTLFTTSGNTNLEDVMVGLNFGEAKNVSLASGSMNTYVGTMAPGATKHITYKITTDATIEPGAIGITVQLTSKNGEPNSSPISIPVTQPERFEITGIEAPETIMMGEEGYLSVTFVNKGKSPVNNLSAEIQGTNLANPGQSQFLGNIAAGTENSVDFNVMASSEGTINGKVILNYEDAKGEVKTLEKEFSCTVEAMPDYGDPGIMDPGMMDPAMGDDVKSGMPWWGWLLIALGVAAVAAVVVVVVLKKKKAKKLAELEDDDEDI